MWPCWIRLRLCDRSYHMDNNSSRSNGDNRRRRRNGQSRASAAASEYREENYVVEEQDGTGGDAEVWNEFTRTFNRVQTVLDRNRDLIQQVNDNQQSRVPDNMARNVTLIQELNGNISAVASLYSDFSSNFSNTVRQHRKGASRAHGGTAGGNTT